jgi:redox-sensitive bicupin YhaK (pirin superfamily)
MNTPSATNPLVTAPPAPARAPHIAQSPRARTILHRTSGQRGGPIVRLVSPSDLGELIKPFVFLDYFDVAPGHAPKFGIHPHSGIATLTFLLGGDVTYEDSTGKRGLLPAGGVEWMRAGGGVWHDGAMAGGGRSRGFQLWVALPEDLENTPPESTYLAPDAVPRVGPARVLLGEYQSAKSLIAAPSSMNYLAVQLRAGERWSYVPPAGHTVGWIAVHEGAIELDAGASVKTGELCVLDASEAAIAIEASVDCGFILGSAIKHPHDLVLGRYSVHTSREALRLGEMGIRQVGARLRAEGKLG